MKVKINYRNVDILLHYIFALILILNCRCQWGYLTTTPAIYNKILNIFLCITIFGIILVKRRLFMYKVKEYILFFFCFSVYFFLYLILQTYKYSTFFRVIFDFFIISLYLMFSSEKNEVPEIFLRYRDIVLIISLYSIVFWIFGSILKWIHPSAIVYSTWTGNDTYRLILNYYNIYYETQSSSLGNILPFHIVRNSAIFTEAPMSSFHFSIAFLIECFLEKNSFIFRKSIFAVAIISTLSTTGYVLLFSCILVKYIIDSSHHIFSKFLKIFLAPLGITISILLISVLLSLKLNSTSGSIRINDFSAGIQAWKENLLLGAGIGNHEYIVSFMGLWRSNNTGFSNSPAQVLAQGGLYIFSLYIFAFLRFIYFSIRCKNRYMVIFAAAFLYLFSFTVVSYQFITFLILIWMSRYYDKKMPSIGICNGKKQNIITSDVIL